MTEPEEKNGISEPEETPAAPNPKVLSGWAEMNLRERIFLCIGIAFAICVGLLMRYDPIHAYSGWAVPPAAAAMLFFTLCTWRRIPVYERVCFCVMSAAMLTRLLCLRFIFVTPTGWGYPLSEVSLCTVFLMMAVLSWRKNRLEAVLIGLLGGGYVIYKIAKLIFKFVTGNP